MSAKLEGNQWGDLLRLLDVVAGQVLAQLDSMQAGTLSSSRAAEISQNLGKAARMFSRVAEHSALLVASLERGGIETGLANSILIKFVRINGEIERISTRLREGRVSDSTVGLPSPLLLN